MVSNEAVSITFQVGRGRGRMGSFDIEPKPDTALTGSGAAAAGPAPRHYLKEGCSVKMLFYEGEALSATLPDEVELQVAAADPSIKARP